MFDPAYTAMRTTLVDAAASWPTKLHAVAELAWAAHVHETLPPFLPKRTTCEQAEQVLASVPGDACQRVVNEMPELPSTDDRR